jgi:hypothetical protein
MLSVDVYGTLCYTPDAPLETLVEGWGKPREEQKWERKELPHFFSKIELDADGNALLTVEQERYAAQEVRRCKEGYNLFINGRITYIAPKHYFYLQWWTLEDDIHPEYRDTDRRYFLFLEHWEKVLWCLGVLRGKKRREGASSQATSNLIYECIFYTNSNCGLVSKTNIDSRDTFTDMVRHGYNRLPVFLKPRLLSKPDSVTELIFGAKIEKGKEDDIGMRSKVNYRAPVLNAYDRGRMSRILGDEGGKWPPEVDFAKFLAIVSKTMVKGAKRVGFGEFPSTVNEMTKGGGAAFKKAWDGANQFAYINRPTPNRMVTYFSPAYDGYEGFIDQWGESVIGEPTHEQYQYLVEKWVKKDPITGYVISELTEEDIKMGARQYVTVKRREGLSGDLLEEEIRMNPCTVKEMFEAANTDCVFNSYNIGRRENEIDANPIPKRKIIFYRDLDQTVRWRDADKRDGDFYWSVTPEFELSIKDAVSEIKDKLKSPARYNYGAISVDSYSNAQGGRKYGSKASAFIGYRHLLKPVAHLYGRPKEKDELHNQVLLAAEFCGFKAYYEHTADDYYGYFRGRGKIRYLGKYPLGLIDPVTIKKAGEAGPERHYGTPLTPFSLTRQLDNGIAYFEHHCNLIDYPEVLYWARNFDPYDRTKADIIVSLLILISVLLEPIRKTKPTTDSLVRSWVNENR